MFRRRPALCAASIAVILVVLPATMLSTSGGTAGAANTYLLQPSLYSVACPGSHACFAVGSHLIHSREKTLVVRMNATGLSMVASPNPPGKTNAVLYGVSCASTTDCFAVGSYLTNSWSRTLIERWNGTNWSMVASPNPPGENYASLSGISCSTDTSCEAVGHDTTAAWAKTLIEHWDGSSWSIINSPNPPGITYVDVSGIACQSSTDCYAVGNYSSHTWARTLVERWDGLSWSIVASPNPHGLIAWLSAVACPNSSSCYAVGHSATQALSERWNGRSWSIVAHPSPPGRDLLGISCSTSTRCVAVGASDYKTLIDQLNGTSWSTVVSPTITGATFPTLNGISCERASTCYAVGANPTNVAEPLVERWNGRSWSIVNV